MKPILNINNVDKHFGGVVAAKDITFDVISGKIHGLIGPNGAGKSTLMNIISGLLKPDRGTIRFDDKDVTNLPPYTRSRIGIGRTFQTPRFLNRSNIDVNLRLGTDLGDYKTGYLKSFFLKQNSTFEKELENLMQLAGFAIDLGKDISSLTYGQLKLLEIVRSLLAHPKAILVDEPCAGLNDKETENVVALLHKAAYESGIGVLLIEHSMDVVMNVCEEIVVINFGQMIAQGTPQEVSANQEVITAYLGRDTDD